MTVLAKGCARDKINWAESRRYFYARLKRRLLEEDAVKRLGVANPTLLRAERLDIVHSTLGNAELTDDFAAARALEANSGSIAERVKSARADTIASSVAKLAAEDKEAFAAALQQVLGDKLNAADLARILA